ncbi:glycosyltransferase family 4 protein [Roseivirga sp.]|uniref:glycosyltransferase family 4 protein n=1 Tax=Roseivirga sp. TaxID=1964215 RepID=UPI003B8CD06E
MKILQVHNTYIGKTGEEAVVEEERQVLEQNGHRVIQFIKNNSDFESYSKFERLKAYTKLKSSNIIAAELTSLIRDEKPDICHVHNTFPLITPVVYKVCKSNNLPVVKTLHNYKLICTNSLLFTEGKVCEKCLNKSLYNSIKYKCYRNSYLATAVQANVIQHHRSKGTWHHLIDQYICLTEFQKKKILSGNGIPKDKAVVKPNFISEPNTEILREDFFLFVGRVHDSKGLQDLLTLFQSSTSSNFVVIGKSDDVTVFDGLNNVKYLGEQERLVVLEYMQRCKAVIFPSIYYEGMPIVILEAFSHKKLVVSRDTGAMSSMIIDGYNGLKYDDSETLVQVVAELQRFPELARTLGQNAFEDFRRKYSIEKGYKNLMKVYNGLLKLNA